MGGENFLLSTGSTIGIRARSDSEHSTYGLEIRCFYPAELRAHFNANMWPG